MTETLVVNKGHGLPYSKGLMAQALAGAGLTPERGFEIARVVERRLGDRAQVEIDVAGLRELAEEVLLEEEGDGAVRRYRDWQRLDRLDRPLVVLLGGTTGVGKSTLATMLAGRLGITRVIATDVIRQVLRAFFSHEFMPSVHVSAFEAGGVDGYEEQAEQVCTGSAAIVERAANEGKPVILEGVHAVPGRLEPELRSRCVVVETLLVVEDEELHRAHFSLRAQARPAERYLEGFEAIRELQDHLARTARAAGVTVLDNSNVDEALGFLMEQVLDTVGKEFS